MCVCHRVNNNMYLYVRVSVNVEQHLFVAFGVRLEQCTEHSDDIKSHHTHTHTADCLKLMINCEKLPISVHLVGCAHWCLLFKNQ